MKIVAMLIFVMAAFSLPAMAGTDYVCLKGCVSIGGDHPSCMAKCGYGIGDRSTSKFPVLQRACFTGCVKGGSPAEKCMPNCTALTEVPVFLREKTPAKKYDVLEAPMPYAGGVIMPKKPNNKLPKLNPETTCLNACTKGKLQYELCAERCSN